MEINIFNDPNLVPKPKEEVKIEQIVITPYADRRRVHIQINVTPFRERPNLMLVAHNAEDRVVGELNIIETMHYNMEFTLHLRNISGDPAGMYTLTAELFYETRNPPQDERVEAFEIPADDSTA